MLLRSGTFVGGDADGELPSPPAARDLRPISKRHYHEKLAAYKQFLARNVGGGAAATTPKPAVGQRSYTELGSGDRGRPKRRTDGDADFFMCDNVDDEGKVVPSPVPVVDARAGSPGHSRAATTGGAFLLSDEPDMNLPFDQQMGLGRAEDQSP